MNKKIKFWIVFCGLKIAEIGGLIIGYMLICNLGYFLSKKGNLLEIPFSKYHIFNFAVGGLGLIASFLVIMIIYFTFKPIIEKNVEWANEIIRDDENEK